MGEGKDLDALYHYSQAIITTPVGSDGKSRELAVLLANRSAVLFSLKAYGMALDDIKLSFQMGYPDDLAYKLYDRKAKCLVTFKLMGDAVTFMYEEGRGRYAVASKDITVGEVVTVE